MENNSFEQQFRQNVDKKMTELVSNPPKSPSPKANVPVIISVVLAIIVLIETIAICIMVHDYLAFINEDNYEVIELEETNSNNNMLLDEEGRLAAMNIICTSSSGAYFILSSDNVFEEHDSASNLLNSGTYSIFNDNLVFLNTPDSDKERIIYFNWVSLADGTTLYDCRANDDGNNA